MDGRQFDAWARRVGEGAASRRGALRLLAGGALVALRNPRPAAATCSPAGKKCGGGECCHDATCRGGRCRCKRGKVACFAGEWGVGEPTNALAVGPGGRVYVAGFDRIRKFDADGTLLLRWGRFGSGEGEFDYPFAVAVGPGGHVYVADLWNNRVQVFDADGTFLTQWGGFGGDSLSFPVGVAVDRAAHAYVADWGRHRIMKFDADGSLLTKWGRNGGDGSPGSGDGEFNFLTGVAVHDDGAGNVSVYVADGYNDRVQRFAAGGAFLGKWGSTGSGDGEFAFPGGVAVDSAGHVYVADSDNDRVQRFAADGVFLGKWGRYGRGNGQFVDPMELAVDGIGHIYVAEQHYVPPDSSNDRVQKLGADGAVLDKRGRRGRDDEHRPDPMGRAGAAPGHRVQKFRLA